jgi:chaperonin GroES
MLEITTKLSLEDIQDSDNIVDLLTEEENDNIGREVCQNYEIDEQSRKKWKTKMEDATELALQLTTPKSYPWPNAANIKFPLLTIAAMQFAARAYPALVKAPDLVKYRVQGSDPDGQKAARAGRISAHMSYQLLEEDEPWEEDQDKAFLALPILGCIFKKSYFDATLGHNCSKTVLPKSLAVHYYAKSIETAERKTEIYELYDREIREKELRGLFKEHEYGPPAVPEPKDEDTRQGMSPPLGDVDTPRTFLEQHCYLDLDGDGYKEPYVITVDKATYKVARIVARIESITTEQSVKIKELEKRIKALAQGLQPPQQGQQPSPQQLQQLQMAEQAILGWQEEIKALTQEKPKVLRIQPIEYYTKYSFIPSPDGGFYDLGFGALLSPINNSVNTIINQLLDAGSLQNGSMGFIGKGARIKGGKVRFSPFEWKRVDVAGGTLRDSLVPLPVNTPSNVLFELLGLLISYAERVGSVTDAMMGENPGQNTPAYNMSAMLEQGLQVFNGIFKRVYRSFRSELRKLYSLNGIYLDQEEYFAYQDQDSKILQADYTSDTKDLIPAADPNAFSNKEKQIKAQMVAERAQQVPGYDPIVIEQNYLESIDVPNSREVYPTVKGEDGSVQLRFPPQPDPELEIEKADMQRRTLEGQSRAEKEMLLAQSKVNVDQATIIKLMADAAEAADKPTLERLKLLDKEQDSIRKSLIEVKKLDEQSKRETKAGVD